MARDRQLVVAGLAAGVSLLLAGAVLAITVIVIGRPPVYQHLSAEANAAFARWRRWDWIAPALNVSLAFHAIAQVALRRPVLVSMERARRWPKVTTAQIDSFGVFAGVAVLFAGRGIVMEIGSLVADTSRPLTDNPSLAGLKTSTGIVSLVLAILSSVVFMRWWQQEEATRSVVPERPAAV
jgi:hypothetical protein